MPSLEELLDQATPTDVEAPSVAALRAELQSRGRRRHRLVVAGGLVLVGLAGFGLLAALREGGLNGTTATETVADGPDGSGGADGADSDPDGDAEPDATQAPESTDTPQADSERTAPPSPDSQIEPANPWDERWFLIPPEPIDIGAISADIGLWEEAQQAELDHVIVTTNPSDPAVAGLASVYHLPDIENIFRIGDPDWDHRSRTTDDGRPARIGLDPNSSRTSAYVDSGPGTFVAIAIGLDEEQTLAVAAAAELVAGRTSLGDLTPPEFTIVPAAPPAATDHMTTISWGDGADRLVLQMRPGAIEHVLAYNRTDDAATVAVGDTPAVIVPAIPDQDGPSIVWAQDGYALTLSSMFPEAALSVEELLTTANRLQRVDQPELVARLDDRFADRQPETVLAWLQATPPPEAWDASPLVSAVPQSQQRMADLVQQYLECTWLAEWTDAVRAGQTSRRAEAEAVLAAMAEWPVSLALADAMAELVDDPESIAEGEAQELARRTEALAAVQSAEQVQAVEIQYGCGFITPGG